ncbi:MAG TPA: non-ribosomal peptide synthetase [Pseudonocardia sp.]|jgi:amino acid adenylation domain-containing protein|nr:non-ribosomal peptide synthetase [Pseudonocardia sp.]
MSVSDQDRRPFDLWPIDHTNETGIFESPVLAGIANRVISIPDSPAMVHGSTIITYAELAGRSDCLASGMREMGVGPETCVALCLERSPDFVTAALAVLKAGAGYLPLDPDTPAEQACYILADSASALLVRQRGTARGWPAGQCRTVDLESLVLSGLEPAQPNRQRSAPGPDELAYVIPTSGSTGRPKGVEITHANLANLIDWHVRAFGVGTSDRASQIAGLGFDAAVWEIWPNLVAGCPVHFADEGIRRSPGELRDWLIGSGITISFAPTGLAEQLLSLDWPAETRLRFLLTGADALTARPRAGLPFTLVNNYGPAECTVVTTSGIVREQSRTAHRPTIGRAISGAKVYVFDDSMDLVTPGTAGELCVAGAVVGRGYRNNPELTRRSFVSAVLPDGRTVRVYRTGDRVRQGKDGEFEFLGRQDRQVQVRGYRVELGEIEAWLARYPGVESCAVLRRPGDPGRSADATEADLVGYLVLTEWARPSANDIRAFLASRLAEYKLPTCFVSLPAFPVTLNGKINWSALPAPTAENVLAGTPTLPAWPGHDEVSGQVAALVTALLRTSAVGVDENFFMLGGNSMLGVQLVHRIRRTFGVEVTLGTLFSGPTVAAVAAEVRRLRAAAAAAANPTPAGTS